MLQRKEHEVFSDRMAFASEMYLSGVKHEELLSRLYCRFLPETKEEEGDWMARHVMERIHLFDEARKGLLELNGRSEEERMTLLGEYIIHRMEGFTLSSQCRKLHSIKQGLDALDQLCKGICTLEETIQTSQPGYRGNTGEKGRNAELQVVLENLFVPLKQSSLENDAARTVSDLRQDWIDDTLFRAVLTVIVYTIVAREENELDLPRPVEYIALAVCCLISDLDAQVASEQRETLDSAVVKLILTSGFLACGTDTVMFTGPSIAIYSAYYLAILAVKRFILE